MQRRIVVDKATNLVLEDESTVGWTREDWHAPPEVPAGSCQVIYVYDERVHPPRGESGFACDSLPFGGLPRQLNAELPLLCTPVGIAGLSAGRDTAVAADADSETDDEWDFESSSSADSSWDDALTDVATPGDAEATDGASDSRPDDVDPWDSFDAYVNELTPSED